MALFAKRAEISKEHLKFYYTLFEILSVNIKAFNLAVAYYYLSLDPNSAIIHRLFKNPQNSEGKGGGEAVKKGEKKDTKKK
jgi:hypothetical protein